MTDQTPENTPFFLTAPMPCPYLEGQEERKLFTHLTGRRALTLHHLLNEHGFRRSQNLVYRPACESCSACRAARVVASEFKPSSSQRRVLRRNADVMGEELPPCATEEQYDLFQSYLATRHHDGGMTQMSYADFEYMVEDTPVASMMIEYRLIDAAGNRGQLVGAALSDVLPDGLSMVYSFFDTTLGGRGLGNYMILDHIRRVAEKDRQCLYLGYWVPNSSKMAYKANYKPLEILTAAATWQRVEDIKQEQA